MADLCKGHLIADGVQISVFAFYLDSLIEESEKGVFHNPFELSNSECFVQGFAWDEVQVGQPFVIACFQQQGVADDSDHPRDDGEGQPKAEAGQEVIRKHGTVVAIHVKRESAGGFLKYAKSLSPWSIKSHECTNGSRLPSEPCAFCVFA